MSDLIAVRGVEPWRRRLFLPAYSIAEAAKYVGESPQTVSNWHYRHTQTGVTLPTKERGKPLSYLQLIELAVVAVFRKLGIPLQNIRKARQYLAQNFNSEYPFTQYRFKTEGLHILLDFAQFEPDAGIRLVAADKAGQLGWAPLLENRLLEFEYECELVMKWYLAGRQSMVVVDPRVAFGAPTVSGIPTWVLKGRAEAGESVADIQEDFGLNEKSIVDGLKFEGVEIPVAA